MPCKARAGGAASSDRAAQRPGPRRTAINLTKAYGSAGQLPRYPYGLLKAHGAFQDRAGSFRFRMFSAAREADFRRLL
ncbi:hypothetical protein GDI1699 [Gluconacetobacter diazotrophicus PA1 5]|uniref:Uncharacterized protein n=1 Tax=Gluconacetobacter diazotrophicus (strain ATCC 49037 / DSM 5601 / CCUG 37298 / CIP 103539 / LMG 7603 / PAl5) TaxID=272568 RepID=A9HHJ3_GLUDA|nr:hypothetical protein GDI1699 [Gluconacetobacter diazotrophicus PA1 5]